MNRMRLHALSLGFMAVLFAPSPTALAQTQSAAQQRAQVLFDDGMKLLKAGKTAEACPKLAESQKIDPGMGTQFRLAECYEKLGKPALAWANFREVAEQAHREKMTDREEVARKRAAAMEAVSARLSIVVPPAVAGIAGLSIQRDGVAVEKSDWGKAWPVEAGAHSVRATAPGREGWTGKAVVGEGVKVEVAIPLLEASSKPSAKAKAQAAPLADPSPQSDTKRGPSPVLGIALGAGAVAGIGAGIALLVVSKGKASAAMDLSGEIGRGGCSRAVPDPRCTELDDGAHSADTFHNAAVGVLVGAGVLAAGTGAYFLWSAVKGRRSDKSDDRHRALHVAPLGGTHGGGLIVSGDF